MNTLATIEEGKFSASILHDGSDLTVHLAGNADVTAKPHLGALFGTVHEQARLLGVTRVQVDIRSLAFMNSSCFKDLIAWLDKVREEAAASDPYRVTFLSSSTLHWQRRSLHALVCFARGLITVEAA
jgi:hypothetical protein